MFPDQLAILNLRGKVHPSEREYMEKEAAFRVLRECCDEDYGEDIDKWEEWVNQKFSDLPAPTSETDIQE